MDRHGHGERDGEVQAKHSKCGKNRETNLQQVTITVVGVVLAWYNCNLEVILKLSSEKV